MEKVPLEVERLKTDADKEDISDKNKLLNEKKVSLGNFIALL